MAVQLLVYVHNAFEMAIHHFKYIKITYNLYTVLLGERVIERGRGRIPPR